MTSEHAFAALCRQVCEQEDWELLPTGIVVRWGDGRHQLVRLEFFEFEREELVRITTTIGDVEQLSRAQLIVALSTNAKLAHGALAIRSGQLVMTDTLMIADSDANEIRAAIEYLARASDDYERAIYGTDEN